MSARYETIQRYFTLGMWTVAQVHKAVEKGWITAKEFEQITGEKYTK